ncbi:lysozyme inhibitor LprI family protein [Novosphingobium sp. 1949]|uniref:Lysozyme inhibitor LprI family protein n=1 Tax=Novosphingobium organovorum TaxID=2930092 RepID=A0ABT0BDH7_9SPHN|nr:lysozyme inhibitor LprI family protein [Novosphingobium organovorum]MCJ2183039.1 lysozyme inhibitor LprI family protein [Novosphingobium organovorum]
MILTALVLAAAAAPDCASVKGALGQDECRLAQSMALDPAPDCDRRLTQFDMNVCRYREYLKADIALNQTWSQLAARWGKDSAVYAKALIAQRAWLTYRDAQCAIWETAYEGGSIVPLVVNDCRTELTRSRIATLQPLLEEH